ncbi:MAG: hypothetical protein HONBIEJF_01589 [Fimbriimonadaceae bacterium]|nr:hypothetical protein [Fimbriimonadaceae bacterium]
MLKHPTVTAGRLRQLLEHELKEGIILDRSPLSVEFCPEPHQNEREAKSKGPWSPVESGFRYGPAYREVWFRVSGAVPKGWSNGQVGLTAEVGGERTVWKDNVPEIGIDGPHAIMPLLWTAKGGEKIDRLIQVYTTNPQCRVHRAELPREDLVETMQKAELLLLDGEMQALTYDFDFAFNLMEAQSADSPNYALLMRGLNDAANLWATEGKESIARCRKVLRDALQSLGEGPAHTMTAVGHAHLDTAWLWPLRITHLKMAHTTANQLRLIERYPEYVFVHSQASQYEWLEQEHPKLLAQVKDAIGTGQWEVLGSMWVEADCNLTGGESLVRQFLYGKRYFRDKLGVETEDMWLPDVFGYSAALPQILRKFGIKAFFTQKISWNQFNVFPHNTFWWQGIDGSRVWTHFSPANTYCGNCEPKELLFSVKNHKDHARCDHSLYCFGYGDGGGGPTERHIEFLRRARSCGALPEIRAKRKALDFFREARNKSADLATWAGELYFEYHRGTYTSQAANKLSNRVSEFLLRDAEYLSCFRDDYPKTYPSAELEEAWKLVLLNQFHDIIPGSSVREVYEDSVLDYQRIEAIGEGIVQRALINLGKHFHLEGRVRPVALFQNATERSQGSIPWEEDEVPTSLSIGGDHLPVQLVEEFDERKIIFPIPREALGTVMVADLGNQPPNARFRAKAGTRRLENDQFSVRFDSNGNITSITSLDDRPMEFIAPGKLGNVFQLLDDHPLFWSAWDVDIYAQETVRELLKSDSFEIVERGPVRVAAEIVKTFGKSRIRQRISLGPTPGIRFDTEIDWHESDTMLKVAFPVNVNATRATHEIQFGNVERPTHANTSWEMAMFETCAQKWADISEGGHGVALINVGKYGYDIRGNVMRLSLLRSPKAPDPQCDMGLHRFTYVLLPHYDQYYHGGVVAAAYSVNSPLRYALLDDVSGSDLTALPPLFSCEDRNLVVESVKKAEDSDQLVVRLYECHNARGTAELSSARRIRRAWLADLEESPISELEVIDNLVMLEYKPFEILTVLVES